MQRTAVSDGIIQSKTPATVETDQSNADVTKATVGRTLQDPFMQWLGVARANDPLVPFRGLNPSRSFNF